MKKQKMTPEEAKQARREAASRWYQKHKAAKNAAGGKKEKAKPAAKAKLAAKRAVNSRDAKKCSRGGCGSCAEVRKAERAVAKAEKALAKAKARRAKAAEKLAKAKEEDAGCRNALFYVRAALKAAKKTAKAKCCKKA